MPRLAALARAFAAWGVEPAPAAEWHETIGSTNDRLKELARRGAPEWTIVMADRQTSGRGRGGRSWVSPPGGLYLSVLLRPRFDEIQLLPLAAGVAVAETASEQGLDVVLKWPNDVLVPAVRAETPGTASGAGDRKLAGILAEGISGPSGHEWVVLGIGVNVTLPAGALPAATASRVAGLAEGSAASLPELAWLAAAIVGRLRVWYDALASSPGSIVQAWRARAIAWWGEAVEVTTAEGTWRGRLIDVDEKGALLVKVGGEMRRLLSGDVARLRREG